MPLYFFHLRDGVDVLIDPEGRELDDMDAIARITLRDAREMIAEDAKQGQIRLDLRIDVEDASGAVVHNLHFVDAVAIVT